MKYLRIGILTSATIICVVSVSAQTANSDAPTIQALLTEVRQLRLALENRTDARVLPTVWVANAALDAILTRRKPVLTATRLLTNQTFRDLYRTDTH